MTINQGSTYTWVGYIKVNNDQENSTCMCNRNLGKTTYHSEISLRVIHLKCSNLEKKAISCSMIILHLESVLNHLNSLYNGDK